MKIKLIVYVLLVLTQACTKSEEEKVYRIGEARPLTIVLDNGSREEILRVTVESVSVEAYEDGYLLGVNLHFMNTGKQPERLHYSETALVDVKERVYIGEIWPHNYRIPGDRIRRMGGLITELQPGMTDQNFAVYRLPRSSFDGDIHFGFLSGTADNSIVQRILVYEKSKSSYSFNESKVFSSTEWN